MKTKNEVVIITGASTGIGKELAEKISLERTVIACVRKEKDKLTGPNIQSVLMDVTSDASVEKASVEMRHALEKAKKVHLINNAGIAVSGPVEGVPLARWKEQFEVNVFGLLRSTQAFLPFIRDTKGKVFNISSISGLFAPPFLGPYCASKFAVEALSDALRREMKEFGVQVILIEPGPVETPIWEKNFSKVEEQLALIKPELRTVYEKGMKIFIKSAKKSAEDAVPVSKVSDIVIRALDNPKAKARYLVGTPQLSVGMFVAKSLPSGVMDALIAKQFRSPI